MAEEYEVLQINIGTFQDNFGNTWCDLALKGTSEPVRIVLKDPRTVKTGDILYGQITEETSKAGKNYLRFRKEQREPLSPTHSVSTQIKQSDDYWTEKDSAIRAQWAIGQAVQLSIANGKLELTGIEADAKELFAMVERVKAGTNGYEKAKQVRDTIEASTNPGNTFSNGEPLPTEDFNMSDIPF